MKSFWMRMFLVGLVTLGLVAGITACGESEEGTVDVEYETETVGEPDEPGSLIGTSIEGFPDEGLMNHRGDQFSFEDLPEKPLVISFFYTRCPMDQMCPRLTRHMVQLQERVNRGDSRPVQFLHVTFDPEFDRPDVLRNYGRDYGVNFDNFSLITGEFEAVERLLDRFKIHVIRGEDTVKSHTMRTYIVDGDGVVQEMYRGSDWSVQEVQSTLGQILS